MNKKIIAIVSTPRKGGNSEILVDEFLKGAVGTGHKIEKIILRDYKINYCKACGYCMNHPGECMQKDDMEWIIKDMINSDVIVFSTPVYKSCMCGQLKTMIDRMIVANKLLVNKDFYFIATAADSNDSIKSTMDSMKGATYILKGAKIKGEIYGGNAFHIGDIINSPAMKEAYNYGKNC